MTGAVSPSLIDELPTDPQDSPALDALIELLRQAQGTLNLEGAIHEPERSLCQDRVAECLVLLRSAAGRSVEGLSPSEIEGSPHG